MSLEERKIRLEIKKLEGETGCFKKTVELISTLSSLIIAVIAIVTFWYAYDEKIIQNLVAKLKNDNISLQIKVTELNKEKLSITNEINKKQKQLDSLKFKFDKENNKYRLLLSKKDYLIRDMVTERDSLGKELVNTENCYSKAESFLNHFIVYDTLYMSELRGRKPPLQLRFNVKNEEIIEADILKMDYLEFLKQFADFTPNYQKGGVFGYLISKDGIVKIDISQPMRSTSRQLNSERKKYNKEFDCWKGLTKRQKRDLLIKVTERPD